MPVEIMFIAVTGVVCSTVLIITLAAMWMRARGQSRPLPALQPIENRLARIEQAIDTMALEMERVSEGQRFVTKLLAERRPESAGLLPGSEPDLH